MNRNEFWLLLHRLSVAYAAEGDTSHEQAESIMRDFELMSPTVRRQLVADFDRLARPFDELREMAIASVNAAEAKQAHHMPSRSV